MDEQQLLQLLWSRSPGAPEALDQAYGKLLYRIAHNILGDHHLAEECVNDAILALWNAIPPNRPDPLISYACGVARNIALNRRREQPGPTLSLEELADYIPAPCYLDDLDARELGQSINMFLGTLSRKNRNLFLRRYWFGDSVKEIAAAFSMTENAVSVRLSRVRDKLRDYLIEEGQYEA